MAERLPRAALQNYFSVMRPSTRTILLLERSPVISMCLDKRKRCTLEILCSGISYHIMPAGPACKRKYQVNSKDSLMGSGILVKSYTAV